MDWVPPSVTPALGLALLRILEDNESVIKISNKKRAPNFRHVPRVRRVDLDWLFERIELDPGIMPLRYVNTKYQIADFLTKGLFTAAQWTTLCKLAQVADVHKWKATNHQ